MIEPTRSVRMIPTPFAESGQPVRLKLIVHTPPTPGPHPVIVFNHGSTGSGRLPAQFLHEGDFPNTARFFAQRGWILVAPQRRGRGGSDGVYDEGFGADRAAGYSCDPATACAGRWPERFAGAINFNGGWLGRLCDTHTQVNPAAFLRGVSFRGPTLWLHGSHDQYYRIAHCRSNFDAFMAAGGQGEFHALRGGHGLIGKSLLWHPVVSRFLDQVDAR